MTARFSKAFLAGACTMAVVLIYVTDLRANPSPSVTSKEREVDLLNRVERTVDAHVVPVFAKLSQTTKDLTHAVEYHCDAQDIGSLKTTESAFRQTVLAWAAAEHLRFGPLRDEGRASHIHFWPDPRGVTRRQMRKVFHEHDAKRLEPDVLKDQSVAVLGLGAVEYFLLHEAKRFANGPVEKAEDYECLYIRGVARLVEKAADTIHAEWTKPDGWRTRILNPDPNHKVFRNADESVAQLVKSLVLGLQLVRSQKIVPLYELAMGKAKRAKVPFQRLGLADDYVEASLSSLKQLNDALSLTDFARGRTEWVKQWTAQGFGALERLAKSLEVPPKKRLSADDFEISQLRQMRFYTNGLRQVIARQTAPSAGLTIGFNELDGD
ncbi:MAG: imelysin family protein [Pseudomonadota bacterium]